MSHKGYNITVVPKGSGNYLSFKPQTVVTREESIATAISFFNQWMYNLPDTMKKCRLHFQELYQKIPKDISYFYAVETHYDINNNPVNKYCYPVGAGTDEIDAYSTYLLFPRIEPSKDNVFKEDGHFVKAYFEGDEMRFEPIIGHYDVQKKASFIKFREKLKKITLAIPIDEAPIPETLKYSNYWYAISSKYADIISSSHTYDSINYLNKQFEESERLFYTQLKLYREYKIRQAEENRSSGMLSLILQGASLAANNYTRLNKRTIENELNRIKENQAIQAVEVQKTRQKALESLRRLEEIKDFQIKEYRRLNIPLNDDPKIDIKFRNELG